MRIAKQHNRNQISGAFCPMFFYKGQNIRALSIAFKVGCLNFIF